MNVDVGVDEGVRACVFVWVCVWCACVVYACVCVFGGCEGEVGVRARARVCARARCVLKKLCCINLLVHVNAAYDSHTDRRLLLVSHACGRTRQLGPESATCSAADAGCLTITSVVAAIGSVVALKSVFDGRLTQARTRA